MSKNKKVEQIANEILNVYREIERKILTSEEIEETKNQLLFLLRLLRPIVCDVTYESHEVLIELKKLDFSFDYERDIDLDRKILYPAPARWVWSYSDRTAARTLLNLNFDVLKNIILKMNKYINSIMLENKNKNIRTIDKDLLFNKADKLLNVTHDSLIKKYRQNYIENFTEKQIKQARKQLFSNKTNNEDKEFILRTFCVDLLILAQTNKHKHLFNS